MATKLAPIISVSITAYCTKVGPSSRTRNSRMRVIASLILTLQARAPTTPMDVTVEITIRGLSGQTGEPGYLMRVVRNRESLSAAMVPRACPVMGRRWGTVAEVG